MNFRFRNSVWMMAISTGLALAAGDSAKAKASGTLDISSQVDHSEITIGDRIQYEIKVVYPADGHVDLPSVLGNLGSFEVKDYQASDPKDAGNLKIQTWHFDLSTYTVGKYTIPPQLVDYRHGTDTTAAQFYTQPIEINVVRTSPETVKDIADIAALAEVKSGQPWLLYGLAALIAVILAYVLWRRFRPKAAAKGAKPALPPFEEAMARLAIVKDLAFIRQNRAREFCFILSEALRRYLDRRYGTDTLESTTSEFLEKARTLPVTVAQKQWLAEFCEATDLVKFANSPLLESDAGALLAKTEEFLRQTRPKENEPGSTGGADAAAPAKKPLKSKPGASAQAKSAGSTVSGSTAAKPGAAGQSGGKPGVKSKPQPGPGYTQGGHGHEDDGKPGAGSKGWTA